MNKEEINCEEKTFDVKQRTYYITTVNNKIHILRTGYIGPCVAFYGRHKDKKVVFMSHVDGNFFGGKNLERELKLLTNENLEGFSLYVTTNQTNQTKIIIFFIFSVITYYSQFDIFLVIFTLLILPYFFFGSLLQICIFSKKFKNTKIKFLQPPQHYCRLQVSINVNSEDEPLPSEDDNKDSKELYGPNSGHCWISGLKRADPE